MFRAGVKTVAIATTGFVGGVVGLGMCLDPVSKHMIFSDQCTIRFPPSELKKYQKNEKHVSISGNMIHQVCHTATYPCLISELEMGPQGEKYGSAWWLRHADGRQEPIFRDRGVLPWIRDVRKTLTFE